MKTPSIILALFLFGAASAHSQTLKTLSYNTTNGQVVYSGSNSLTFTNALQFSTNARAATRANLGATTVGANLFTLPNPSATGFLRINDNNSITTLSALGFRTAIGLGVTNVVTFARANIGTTDGTLLWFGLPAQLSVQGTGGRHAIIANAPAGGGAAVIATSSSGAAAGKFYQDSNYHSPALWVSRPIASADSPTLGIGSTDNDPPGGHAKAISVSYGANEAFFVRYEGSAWLHRDTAGTNASPTLRIGAEYGFSEGKAISVEKVGGGEAFFVRHDGTLVISSPTVPAATNSTGVKGQIAFTNNFFYICISNNTWRRVQLGTW